MSVAWVGVGVAAAGSAASAHAQSSAAKDAAEASRIGSDQALRLQGMTKAEQAPYVAGGRNALQQMLVESGFKNANGGSAAYVPISRNDLVNRNGAWTPNKELYDNSADYRKDWDAFNTSHWGFYGEGANDARGSVYSPGMFKTFDIDAYNAQQQQATNQQVEADPNAGDLLRPFDMADYQADPGLDFRRQQGEQGLARAAAASGRLGSGRYLKDAMSFNSGLASQEYGNAYNRYNANQTNRFNRLASIAGIGQTAVNQVASANNNAGTLIMGNAANQGNALLTAANARASGYNGIAQALGGANWSGRGSQPTTNYAGGSDQWTGNSDYAWD